jgi:ribosomal protein L11
MSNIARPKLIIHTKELIPQSKEKGKKVVDDRVQKLNTILGPRGIRTDELLKKFDALTIDYENGTPLPVYLYIIVDQKGRSVEYSFTIGMPSTSFIVKRKLKLEKLAKSPDLKKAIFVADKKFVEEVIQEKTKLYTSEFNYDRLFKCLIGSLLSFGIKYQDTNSVKNIIK